MNKRCVCTRYGITHSVALYVLLLCYFVTSYNLTCKEVSKQRGIVFEVINLKESALNMAVFEGHATKRQRTDVAGRGVQSGAGYIKMLPRKGEALVEFEDLESGKACVEYLQLHPNNVINVGGNPAYFDYYDRQRIPRPGEVEMEEDSTPPNCVLLITVLYPKYPMDTQVIHKVADKDNNVLRIVMIRKNGVQAMVEYPFTNCSVNPSSHTDTHPYTQKDSSFFFHT
ncbi:putative heterogeneous nuclear ribonucleoprotein L [Apostichopus japonicus]|uniref:Putative heterogeneous nuclear ribonucleoprotein L n=1 Tax=Stichopus japonicus TaxID=307972 RepID=A0A2G8L798_STIJA|nr:putative heterogeneous nuclear ribonucleoprotein L [Apostichopus japonicus]